MGSSFIIIQMDFSLPSVRYKTGCLVFSCLWVGGGHMENLADVVLGSFHL